MSWKRTCPESTRSLIVSAGTGRYWPIATAYQRLQSDHSDRWMASPARSALLPHPVQRPVGEMKQTLAVNDAGASLNKPPMSAFSAQRQLRGGVFFAFKLRSLAIGTRPRFHVEVEMFVVVIIRLGA